MFRVGIGQVVFFNRLTYLQHLIYAYITYPQIREAIVEKLGGGIVLTDDQKSIIKRCVALRDGDDRAQGKFDSTVEWKPLKSPSPFVAMHMRFDEKANETTKRSIATGKAVSEIDTSAAEAAAWCWDFCSNERMRINMEEGNPARLIVGRVGFAEQTLATVKRMPFLLSNREGVFRQVLSKSGGKIIIANESVIDDVDYGRKMSKRVRMVGKTLLAFEPLSTKSCTFTFFQIIDAGGWIPTSVMNLKTPESLSVVTEAREHFRRDEEIDKIERGRMAALMGWKESASDRESEDGEVRGTRLGVG